MACHRKATTTEKQGERLQICLPHQQARPAGLAEWLRRDSHIGQPIYLSLVVTIHMKHYEISTQLRTAREDAF